jgi:hypothetical protein
VSSQNVVAAGVIGGQPAGMRLQVSGPERRSGS